MSNTNHILGLDESDLFYGKIPVTLIPMRMLITVRLPAKSTSSQAEMGRTLRRCTQTGWREQRQVAEDGADEILKRDRCQKCNS